MNRRTLGRGLSALLGGAEEGDAEIQEHQQEPSLSPHAQAAGPSDLEIGLIDANPYQPRQDFDPAEIDALADSFRVHGLLQPIAVRRVHDRYQLIAGERRLRAARQLGWSFVPARVIEIDDKQTCELALVENLQRKDLNAIEKAQGFQRYIEQFQATHDSVAKQIGVDRSTVTNLLRLLDLPEAVQEMVVKGRIANGHARAILTIEDPLEQLSIAQEVADRELSVRQTEALVRERKSAPQGQPTEVPADSGSHEQHHEEKSNHVASIEDELRQRLGIKVQIRAKGTAGDIVLSFGNNDDFERILEQLRRGY